MSQPEINYLDEAKKALQRFKEKYKIQSEFDVQHLSVVRQGNFTIVNINQEVLGASKRNPGCDFHNPRTGFHYALNKAFRYHFGVKKK